MMDKLKLVVSLLLVVAGIAGFYLLEDKALVLRILAVMAGIAAGLAVMWTSPLGKDALGFVGDSVAEAKRVVWPTRKETIQTTIAVFVLVLIMAAFLAVVDIGFAYMVQWLMGRSA
ncbi:preprotein translocase, SecE subunit [Methylophilaceae bacterium 11]|jgi:preprotein translocase subunit SecE|uniref:preprotein translocase subunit SecE n=1 Tax=unclassified Methylotenera TaxID=2643294 RepID=UPI00036658E1|nr:MULTISPECIES: preprotein translocase subunit SecE [unclassified Methylotenera]EUJ09560.1 preprotein translocase, SecE subunit [Methylophilaceae bacterium 11]